METKNFVSTPVSAENPWGISAGSITITAKAASAFLKLYKYDTAKTPEAFRPPFEAWLSQYLNSKASEAAAKYAEAQAEQKLRSYIEKYAQTNEITFKAAAEKLGVLAKLREYANSGK